MLPKEAVGSGSACNDVSMEAEPTEAAHAQDGARTGGEGGKCENRSVSTRPQCEKQRVCGGRRTIRAEESREDEGERGSVGEGAIGEGEQVGLVVVEADG